MSKTDKVKEIVKEVIDIVAPNLTEQAVKTLDLTIKVATSLREDLQNLEKGESSTKIEEKVEETTKIVEKVTNKEEDKKDEQTRSL